jgi:uncharacterized protein (TIGR03545 family)
MARFKIFRWKAVVPLGVFLALVAVAWVLLLDVMVEQGLERTGSVLVGARVDLEDADVRVGDGSVVLRGLQVTNPDRPMANLLEADEIVVDFRLTPLLERKVLIDTVALRGMRFNTERETSGALDDPPPEAGRLRRELDAWAEAVRVPPLSLEGIGQAVHVAAIHPESLETVRRAEAVAAFADSLGTLWDRQLGELDPQPHIDSTRVLIQRLQNADPARLGVTGVTSLATSARRQVESVQQIAAGVAALDSTARNELAAAQQLVRGMTEARDEDLARARGLLRLPSLDGPEVSPAIFGDAAIAWIRPILYWVRQAEQYLPPGLDPRTYAGSGRTRDPGTTVLFPRPGGLPRFLLQHGEASFAIAGDGAAAGQYLAQINGLTSSPTLYGQPLVLRAERAEGRQGPSGIRLFGLLDHVSVPIQDSVDVQLSGISLPSLDLAPVGARLHLRDGSTALSLERSGDQIRARWTWRSGDASWERLAVRADTASGAIGSSAWAADLLWRSVAGIRDVEIDVRLSGSISSPRLTVGSNVGSVVAQTLRRELGRELERVESEIRARVDSLAGDQVARAEAAVAGLEARLRDEIAPLGAQIAELETRLQQEIRNLTRRLPGGLRIP